MTNFKLHFVLLIFLLFLHANIWALNLYVSPTGNDNNNGSIQKPFQTIERARNEIRKLDKTKLDSNIQVIMLEGDYKVSKTIVFEMQDGGLGEKLITYTAAKGAKVNVSGGVEITGWKKLTQKPVGLPTHVLDKVWVADLPTELGLFRTLFKGDERLPRAQSPDFWEDPYFSDPKIGTQIPRASSTMVYLPKGTIRNWNNISDIEIYVRSLNWTVNMLPLKEAIIDSSILVTSVEGTYGLGFNKAPGWMRVNPFLHIENAIDYLDEPGEWVVNTKERKIYLYPLGEKPENIIAPALTQLIRVEGVTDVNGPFDKPVKNIVFNGITFKHADKDVWDESDAGIQHDWEMLDQDNSLIRFRGAENCKVENCTFTASGGNAIRLDYHAQNITVQNNEINHMGLGGIMLLGYGPGTKDVNKYNKVINNHIHHCGEILWHSHGIVMFQSGENLVAHNYIHHMPRKAICITGVRVQYYDLKRKITREFGKTMRWHEIDPADLSAEALKKITIKMEGNKRECFLPATHLFKYAHARNNIVEYNEVEHCLEKLSDGAAMNVSGGGTGNILRRNYIHHILGDPNPREEITSCMRTDDAQWETLFEENIIANSRTRAFEHKCENDVINNFVINVRPTGVISALDSWGPFLNSKLRNNIFVITSDDPMYVYRVFNPSHYVRFKGMDIDNNIYYDVNHPGLITDDLKAVREQGLDKNSFYGDPLFKDWVNGDYRFQPNSPALKMGIKPIDISKMGLLKNN